MQTETYVAKVIRFFTKKPYNHASLAGDAGMRELYSFCRTNPKFPLPATFNIETQERFSRFQSVPCEIYEISVTVTQKQQFNELMRHFIDNREKYTYNSLGLGYMLFNIKRRSKNKFVCSQFVAYTLKRLGLKLKKPVSLCTPDDLRFLPESKLMYKGELQDYFTGKTPLVSKHNEPIPQTNN
jgi:hypothetical protein